MRRAHAAFATLLLWGAVSPLAAQRPRIGAGRVGAFVEPVLLASSVGEGASALAGAGLGVALGEVFAVGGRGAVLLGTARARSPGTGIQTLDLDFGYGGVLLEFAPRSVRGVSWGGSLLLGAGSADVSDSLTGVELGSDNVVVVEPGLHLALRISAFLDLRGGLSYRWVGSVQDLQGVGSSDLGAAALGVAVRYRRAP